MDIHWQDKKNFASVKRFLYPFTSYTMRRSFFQKFLGLLSLASLLVSLTADAAFADNNRGKFGRASTSSHTMNSRQVKSGEQAKSPDGAVFNAGYTVDSESTKMILKYPPRLLYLQWGSLLTEQKPSTPATNVVDWSGYVEVNKGALKIVKKVRFENSDTASVSSLSDGRFGRVAWTSTISGGQDGLLLLFGAPNDATFTISTPYLGVQNFIVSDLVKGKGYYKRGIDVNRDGKEDDYDFKVMVKSPFALNNPVLTDSSFLEMTVGCHTKDKNTCLNANTRHQYSVTVGISGMVAEIAVKPFRMEKNTDSITAEKSSASIMFDVSVGPFTDGVTVRVKQTGDVDVDEGDILEDRTIAVTVKEGDTVVFEKTFVNGDEFGQFALSNGSGHSFMILNRLKGNKNMSQSQSDQYALTQERLSVPRDMLVSKIDELLQQGILTQDAAGSLLTFIDGLARYNWDETVSGDVDTLLQNVSSLLKTQRVQPASLQSVLEESKKQEGELRVRARNAKYMKKLIPFRDVDDSEWFSSYVQTMADKNIVSGYSDSEGKELGEFRPSNRVTKAEILKMALNTLGKDIAKSGAIKHAKAASHWAKDYVRTAEQMNLTLVSDSNVDLDGASSRGDVIRLIFEAMDVTPPAVSSTRFSDVTDADSNAEYIEYAAELEIVSGDMGANGNFTGTFRPNDAINRAEVSKILNKVMALTSSEM